MNAKNPAANETDADSGPDGDGDWKQRGKPNGHPRKTVDVIGQWFRWL